MWNLALPAFIEIAKAFIKNESAITTVESGIRLGIDLFAMGQEAIAGSVDSPAEQLAEANALVEQLQAVRDRKEAELEAKAPNS